MRFLAEHGVEGERCAVVAGRGGILKAIPGGVYRVNARMLRELRASKWGEHPCNLGAPLAHEIARATGAAAFIVDPPVVDEMWPLARYSGHPAFVRKSRFHALSQRAAARRAARELKIPYEKINLIVVHMGGGHHRRCASPRPRGRCERRARRRGPDVARTQRLVAHRHVGKPLLFRQSSRTMK